MSNDDQNLMPKKIVENSLKIKMKGHAWKNGILTVQKLDGVIHCINYYSVDKY